jgi:hypothetical protein
MMYTPDGWMIVKITGTNPHYRVFGSWRGGYLSGDSWRMNSGIISVKEDGENYYVFEGHSGSKYYCHKEGYGRIGPYNSGVLGEYVNKSGGHMEGLKDMPDIMNMDWIIKNERHLADQ